MRFDIFAEISSLYKREQLSAKINYSYLQLNFNILNLMNSAIKLMKLNKSIEKLAF